MFLGGELVKEKTAVKLTSGDYVEIKSTDKNAQVLFISSVLLNEPVVWGGPIVMNTKEELNKAFDDLRKGTFIQKTISTYKYKTGERSNPDYFIDCPPRLNSGRQPFYYFMNYSKIIDICHKRVIIRINSICQRQ